jgi:N-acetylneuraminate synthase
LKSFKIGSRTVGEGGGVLIVAEIGVNHQGSVDLALELIRQAHRAGADAVKFQKRSLRDLYVPDVLDRTNVYERPYQYLIPILRRVELSRADYERVADACRRLGLMLLCTPFDRPSADFVESLGVPAFKIASCDSTNFDLLEYVAGKGRPMIVSTGASSRWEIERTAEFLHRLRAVFALMHCRTAYPTRVEDVELRLLEWLKTFGVPVGYSGHETSTVIPAAAAALGACIIEKHLTLDRGMEGPDHRASLTPDEFAAMVAAVREVERASGGGAKKVTQGEVINREVLGKSLVAARPIRRGETITREMIAVKSPAKGLSPQRLYDLISRPARRDIGAHDYFTEADLGGAGRAAPPPDPFGAWGVIVRFDDAESLARSIRPRALEFHLTPPDLDRTYEGDGLDAALVLHTPEYVGDALLDLCVPECAPSVAFVRRVFDLADRIRHKFVGTPKLIVHPGGMSTAPMSPAERRMADRTFREVFRKLRDEATARGLILLPENLPPFPWYYGGQWHSNVLVRGAEIIAFVEELEADLCFDFSHAQLACAATGEDLVELFRRVRPRVKHMHVADATGVNGEGVQIGEGDVPFAELLPIVNGYRDTWVPEIWQGHLNGGRGFLKALERLEALYRKAVAPAGA